MNRWKTDVVAGLTTFFTMAYIVIVNPAILSTQGTGMSFSGVLTATTVLCFAMTLLMGLYAKLPFGVAPGMGINAFFTYSVILGKGVPWPIALGMVFWAGVVFLLISITPLRESIARAVPHSLRLASGVGIGIFLTFIGLKNMGLIQADPVTFVKAGPIGTKTALSLLGLLVMVALLRKKNPFAFLMGIFGVTLVAGVAGLLHAPEHWFSAPDFESVFFKLDPMGALQLSLLPIILSILLTDFFDSISTFVGVSQATGLLDSKGNPKNLRQGLIVDAFATLGAGLVGTSSGTAYIESSAGIEVGGRSGRSAVITAFCFLPCLFIAPAVQMVPDFATAPVLVLVGALMFRSITQLKLTTLEEMIPSFLTIVLIPLTFSITQGILWGFLSYVLLFVLAKRRKELSPILIGLAGVSAVTLFFL